MTILITDKDNYRRAFTGFRMMMLFPVFLALTSCGTSYTLKSLPVPPFKTIKGKGIEILTDTSFKLCNAKKTLRVARSLDRQLEISLISSDSWSFAVFGGLRGQVGGVFAGFDGFRANFTKNSRGPSPRYVRRRRNAETSALKDPSAIVYRPSPC